MRKPSHTLLTIILYTQFPDVKVAVPTQPYIIFISVAIGTALILKLLIALQAQQQRIHHHLVAYTSQ